MKHNKFSISQRLRSIKYAYRGLGVLIREEHNTRVHLGVATVVLIAGFVFKITAFEWIAVVFASGFVITLEIVNTAIEDICDFISPEKHEMIKRIKDLSAAGVLVSAIIAVIIGLIVFVPKIAE